MDTCMVFECTSRLEEERREPEATGGQLALADLPDHSSIGSGHKKSRNSAHPLADGMGWDLGSKNYFTRAVVPSNSANIDCRCSVILSGPILTSHSSG